MSAGAVFSDPVTGVRTVKLTDESTDVVNRDWVSMYSTMGLAISRPWGPNLDQYTIAFHGFSNNNAITLFCDYQLGGTTSNYRPAPNGEGRMAFARSDGNAQILYYVDGVTLRRYNTAIDADANTGIFPIPWVTDNSGNTWLNTNFDDTWAAGHDGGANNTIATALNMVTGQVLTRPADPAQNEPYMGSGKTVFLNIGSNKPPNVFDAVWNLETDIVELMNFPTGWLGTSHSAVPLGNVIYHHDIRAVANGFQFVLIDENNVVGPIVPNPGYWSDTHSCGYWWDIPTSTNPQILYSHDASPGTFDEPTWEMTLMLIDTVTGFKHIVGHHYSVLPSGITSPGYASPIQYYDESHAHISHDGKLIIYTSSMNQTIRHDAFIMELPRA